MMSVEMKHKVANTPCPLCGKVKGYYTIKKCQANIDILEVFSTSKTKSRKLMIKQAQSLYIADLVYCRVCKASINSCTPEELGILHWLIVRNSKELPINTKWNEEG